MPRLEHRKSRKGCRRCRDRKVKCDEIKPVCGACEKHNVPCKYQDQYTFAHVGAPPSRAPSQNVRATLSPQQRSHFNQAIASSQQGSQRDRLMELRLMHHYTSVAYKSLFFANVVDVARDYLPELSIDHEFLLDALLAYSALHLHRHNPDSGEQHYWQAHRAYFERAIAGHRTAVELIVNCGDGATQPPETKDPHFLAMALIAAQTFLLLSEDTGAYELPMLWVQYLVGMQGIVAQFQPLAGWSGRLMPFLADAKVHVDGLTDETKASAMTDLCKAWTQYDAADAEHEETFGKMLQCLGAVHIAMRQGVAPATICRKLFMTPVIVNRTLARLLATRNHRMLAMLGHLFLLFAKVEDAYPWFKGIAERQIQGIAEMLPLEWKMIMYTMPSESP